MKMSPQENTQLWIENWKRASVALKAVKRRELRTYDNAKNRSLWTGCYNGLLNTERRD